jgi:hypothetical protein
MLSLASRCGSLRGGPEEQAVASVRAAAERVHANVRLNVMVSPRR